MGNKVANYIKNDYLQIWDVYMQVYVWLMFNILV